LQGRGSAPRIISSPVGLFVHVRVFNGPTFSTIFYRARCGMTGALLFRDTGFKFMWDQTSLKVGDP
ncbi:MAG: hypothetical protein QF414_00495, partial [Arenicellales bacterium]|nr:hypothetical protein [Arenicellales bacterium]